MKKIFLFLVIFALSFGAKAQTWTPIFGKQRFASGLGIPTKDSTYFAGTADSSLIYINPKDAGLYYKYKGYHKKVGTGTVSSIALTMPSAFSVSGSPITNNGTFIVTGAGTISQYIRGDGSLATFPSLTGYVPYTGATANVNLGSYNLTANNIFDGYSSITASGTQVVLTFNSVPSYLVNGSGGQTIKLPDATTIPKGAVYVFNNNQSSGTISVNNNSNTLVKSVPSGGYLKLELTDNANAAGSWDAHFEAPSNVSWSTNTLDYAGSITSATWNGNTVQPNRGGTGQSSYTDGQLLIGNSTGNTLSKATLTAGAGISVTNGAGSISVASTITQYTDANARAALSFTAGSGAYNSTTGVITIPTNTNQLTNGASFITLGSLSGTNPIGYNSTTGAISITQANGTTNGYLSSTDWTTFNSKQSAITLTTTGSSGSATFVSNTLNVPTYTLAGLGGQPQLNGTGFVKASGTTISYDNSTYLTTTLAALTYVPYTGAITAVNLGVYNLDVANVNINGAGSSGGALRLKQFTASEANLDGYNSISTLNTGVFYFTAAKTSPNFKNFVLNPNSLTDNTLRTYTLPDASGTIALTSDLSSYVPYTGATGAVNLGAYDLTVNSIKVGRGAGAVATNTAIGNGALNANTTGGNNTALGYLALISNTTGGGNTAIGKESLYTNTTGGNNVANGYQALNKNTTGGDNTAVGNFALSNNTTASSNIAVGGYALFNNTTGTYNTSLGFQVNVNNTTGSNITAVGFQANVNNTTGNDNTAVGYQALAGNTTGYYNTVLGKYAGQYITTGNSNTIIGAYAGTAAMSSNVILSDGAGNIRFQWDGTNIKLNGNTVGSNAYTSTAYLPLSGGTLTGALSGTSASFVGGTGGLNFTSSTTITNTASNGYTAIYANGGGIYLGGSASVNHLSIVSTGAATFSSSVTAQAIYATDATGSAILTTNGGGEGILSVNTANPLRVLIAGSEKVRINSSGNVGIGTTAPFSQGSGATTMELAGNTYGQFFVSANSASIRGVVMARASTLNDVYIASITNSPLLFGTNDIERMRITSDGKVGVGTNSVNSYAKFEVLGNIMSSGSSTILMLNNTGGTAQSWWLGQDISGSNDGIFYIYNQTSSTQAINIRKNNNVLLGTTTDIGARLHSNGNIISSGSGGSNGLLSRENSTSSTYGFFNAGNSSLVLTNSGVANVGYFSMSTGVYVPTSDFNKKKDFEESKIGLNEVLQLKPTLYRMKTDNTNGEKELGFIAQEVKGIIPSAYQQSGDFIGLNFNAIVAALVKAVQEQQGQIKELNQKITNLEAQIKQ